MPELPEVEHLRRTLEPLLVGAHVIGVQLRRRDMLRGPRADRRLRHGCLLNGTRIAFLLRHGKHLAIVSDCGSAMGIHLGMSGRLWFQPQGERLAMADHVHCIWRLRSAHQHGRLIFRDPRRFGGLWSYDSIDSLRTDRWRRLGPDALQVSGPMLEAHLGSSARAIKNALLDQRALAGVGNIYADEALFTAAIHPLRLCNALSGGEWKRLAAAVRRVLAAAIKAGGSTIRDYRDGNGELGHYADRHRVYGRGGQPCLLCRGVLSRAVIGQRSSVFCRQCQPAVPAA